MIKEHAKWYIEHAKWYIECKSDQIKSYIHSHFTSSVSDLNNVKTWFKIYLVLFIMLLASYYLGYATNMLIYSFIILFIGLVVASIYKDVSSGYYIHWHREKYKERVKNGME
jgi:general stress protein CsbA